MGEAAPPASGASHGRSSWLRGAGARRFAVVWTTMLFAAMALASSTSRAVLIAGPDASINVTAPEPDPGFAYVGVISGLSGVYVANGWVLTARHVGLGPIALGGVLYEPVPDSTVHFYDGSGLAADLIAFKLEHRPPLPDLVLASAPPSSGEKVVMIGNGRDRGEQTTWMGLTGWLWKSTRAMRWGTNRVSGVDLTLMDTLAFRMSLDRLTGSSRNDPEAQAVPGDSGGGVFVWNGARSELAGILFAQGLAADQPPSTSFYGNVSYAADLDAYRDQILDVIGQPDCADGLDEDGDGAIDYPDDPGCESAVDDSELDASLVCDNGLDDDGDGLIDFPKDPGCSDLFDPYEVPEPSLASGVSIGLALLGVLGARRRVG